MDAAGAHNANPQNANDRQLVFGIMVAGMVWLAFAGWVLASLMPYAFHGFETYDLYYSAILDGRFDLPARTLRFEGHYAADGTGYLYHGVAPLLTRFALGWFWPFEILSMSSPSIWLWAVIGTAGYQLALIDLVRRNGSWEKRRNLSLIICAGLWLAGPGLILVSNQAFYHEPIAVSFGMTGLFVAIWVRMVCGKMTSGMAVIALALFAAIAFHARPNVAVSLYAGVAMLIGWGLWKQRTAFALPALMASALLGASVAGFLALNEARFGDATRIDGSYTDSERVYGSVFWGFEAPNSRRASASETYGRFNALRMAPNSLLYTVDLPPQLGLVSNALLLAHRKIVQPNLGMIRVEDPRVGIVFLWLPWIWLAAIGLRTLRRDLAMAALAASMTLTVGLILAYATVTMRYRIDMWPLLGVLALLGTVRVVGAPDSTSRGQRTIFPLLCIGLLVSLSAGYQYSAKFRETSDSVFFGPWPYETCLTIVGRAGFEGDDLEWICREPSMGGV